MWPYKTGDLLKKGGLIRQVTS